jgi:hypothetical protein
VERPRRPEAAAERVPADGRERRGEEVSSARKEGKKGASVGPRHRAPRRAEPEGAAAPPDPGPLVPPGPERRSQADAKGSQHPLH